MFFPSTFRRETLPVPQTMCIPGKQGVAEVGIPQCLLFIRLRVNPANTHDIRFGTNGPELVAANGSSIKSYGKRLLTLYFPPALSFEPSIWSTFESMQLLYLGVCLNLWPISMSLRERYNFPLPEKVAAVRGFTEPKTIREACKHSLGW